MYATLDKLGHYPQWDSHRFYLLKAEGFAGVDFAHILGSNVFYEIIDEVSCNLFEPGWLVGKIVDKDEYDLIGSAKYVGILDKFVLHTRLYCLLIDILHYVSHCASLGLSRYVLQFNHLLG